MPIYEYLCSSCGRSFEELARTMDDPEGLICPQCGSRKVERQLSVFAARQAEVERLSCGTTRCDGPDSPCCPYRPNTGGCCPP